MNRRAVVTGVVAVGLLVAPVPLTRVLGAWVASGVVLVTAALVCGIDAVARERAARVTGAAGAERTNRSSA